MISSYKEVLMGYKGMTNEVTLHRSGAPDIKGRVIEVSDFGCTLVSDGPTSESETKVFVGFEDIRGVAILRHAAGE